PNPSEGIVNISFEQVQEFKSLRVMSASGQVISELQLTQNNTQMLDLSALAAGTYFLIFVGDERIEHHPLLIK
ncbi:MAG: T9SS type A sorting domain-containing protein, partial [Flavobacteriales bacterium]|nr:T9SS type A sorting domain-containing protein [Flavobacteriales bacterium]